ncbi:hypothetical protein K438DRAFT_2138335 [Mycena galopus ATCC 62051]|nr:hypothetical protein K438DRAFT_2138335 [Mycena galopus ATCC 62051]
MPRLAQRCCSKKMDVFCEQHSEKEWKALFVSSGQIVIEVVPEEPDFLRVNGPNHKRKSSRPQLQGPETITSISHIAQASRRMRVKTTVVSDSAGPSVPEPDFWGEDLSTNLVRDSAAFSYDLGDDSVELSQMRFHLWFQLWATGHANVQDHPLQNWYPMNDEYVEENLCRESRGAPRAYAQCSGSRCIDRRQCPARECDGMPEWRCVDQACIGELMFCEECIVATHVHHPTHFVEKWNGTHFVRNRRWLQILGLRVQLGHPPGVICPFREAAAHDFVLYDTTGVHELNIDFCSCLNCLGKLSAYDFLRGLEMTTNHNGLDKPPDCQKPFMHIMRQWREVKRQKRARRGHCAGGVRATQQGELVLPCRACPQPGWNLPDRWHSADTVYKFLYYLFLAQDANFRLSNRVVSSEAADPIMGDGTGYFCKHYGEDGYNAHIEKNVGEVEMSNCSSFNAMHQANLKRTKGLRTTGIGSVTCSRHNMWRANRIGDLQVGEREGVEQNWVFSNGAAASTRLMGPGSRHATLEDIFGFHNYDRLLAMHRVLPKRLAVAIQDGEAYKASLRTFTKGLEQERPDEVQKWRVSVEKWYSVQHTTAEDSPFELQEEVTTLRDIQSQIAAEELICTGKGLEIERDHTPGAFITMGLEIEEVQRRLAVDVRAVKDASPTQKLVTCHRSGATRLFMPSEIPDRRRREEVCALGLPEIEARMREGEATEALEAVRTGLRRRTMTNRYKLRNYTGQGMMTKGQGFYGQLTGRYCASGRVARGEGSRTMSWICSACRVVQSSGTSDRYDEEVRSCARKCAAPSLAELPGASGELTEGRRAYAAEHASVERARCADLEKRWSRILQKADAYLDGGDSATRQQVTLEVDLEDELDPEQEARLEGEEEDLWFPSA